jgi:hypothetical protein
MHKSYIFWTLILGERSNFGMAAWLDRIIWVKSKCPGFLQEKKRRKQKLPGPTQKLAWQLMLGGRDERLMWARYPVIIFVFFGSMMCALWICFMWSILISWMILLLARSISIKAWSHVNVSTRSSIWLWIVTYTRHETLLILSDTPAMLIICCSFAPPFFVWKPVVCSEICSLFITGCQISSSCLFHVVHWMSIISHVPASLNVDQLARPSIDRLISHFLFCSQTIRLCLQVNDLPYKAPICVGERSDDILHGTTLGDKTSCNLL